MLCVRSMNRRSAAKPCCAYSHARRSSNRCGCSQRYAARTVPGATMPRVALITTGKRALWKMRGFIAGSFRLVVSHGEGGARCQRRSSSASWHYGRYAFLGECEAHRRAFAARAVHLGRSTMVVHDGDMVSQRPRSVLERSVIDLKGSECRDGA